jgi:hypothetical protein
LSGTKSFDLGIGECAPDGIFYSIRDFDRSDVINGGVDRRLPDQWSDRTTHMADE